VSLVTTRCKHFKIVRGEGRPWSLRRFDLHLTFNMTTAKVGDLNPSDWSAELRRAVISVRPDFFGLPAQDRLRYRVKLPEADRQAIVAALLNAQRRAWVEVLARGESHDQVAVQLQNQINEWLQPLIGIGADAFSFNEHFHPGQSLIDFPNLLAYDQNDHALQEDARSAIDPDHVRTPYAGALHGTWARCMRDGRLCYLTLSMAASRALDVAHNAVDEEIERLIPHRFVSGPKHGHEEDGLVQWDQRVDAAGHERLLEELQRRVWRFEDGRFRDLHREINEQQLGSTFLIEDPYPAAAPDEQNLLVVFSDPSALERVRLASFLQDCTSMAQPHDWLRQVEARETERVLQYVTEQHRELLRTLDPKVLPLRRRRRLMMNPKTFDDLA